MAPARLHMFGELPNPESHISHDSTPFRLGKVVWYGQTTKSILSRGCSTVARDLLIEAGPAATLTPPYCTFALHQLQGWPASLRWSDVRVLSLGEHAACVAHWPLLMARMKVPPGTTAEPYPLLLDVSISSLSPQSAQIM